MVRVRYGEMGMGERETRESERASEAESLCGAWCVPPGCLRFEPTKLQPRPGQQERERERKKREMDAETRSVGAPPDRWDVSRRRGTEPKKGAKGGRWYSDSQVSFFCSDTQRELGQGGQTTTTKKSRREGGEEADGGQGTTVGLGRSSAGWDGGEEKGEGLMGTNATQRNLAPTTRSKLWDGEDGSQDGREGSLSLLSDGGGQQRKLGWLLLWLVWSPCFSHLD